MSCFKTFGDHLKTLKINLQNKCKTTRCQKGTAGIPLATKLLYGLGGVPYQITTVAMNVSLQIFLLDIVQMEAFYVSMILFVSRFWDAVTDPLVGYLVSRSRWTHIGKLMPWLILSTPLGVLSYILMWFLPHGSMSHAVSVPWFLTTACLFETLMSCYNVPYLSLSMFLGGDQRDRDSATAYRMGVEMLAMLVASVIQGQVVAVYNTEREGACQQQLIQSQGIFQTTASPPTLTASLQGTKKAFLTSALVMGALFFLCSLLLFLGVKEQQAPICSQEKVQLSYLTSLKMLLFHVPYQRLVLGYVFSALAFQMSLGNFALFCTYAAGQGSQFQHLLLVLLVAACIALPLWQAVLIRIGKKTTVIIGLSVFIPAVIVIACMPTNLPVFMMMCVLMGCSLATLFLLPWSMLPDVVDDFSKMNPSCQDLEPLFFSCYAFCSKLGGGLAVGISTMSLHFAGYRAGSCDAGDSVVMALIILFSPVSIVLLLIGLVSFYFYPINERQQVQTQLTTTQSEVASLPEERVQLQPQSSGKSNMKQYLKSHPATKTGTLHRSKSLPYRHKSHNNSNQKYSAKLNNLSKCSSVEHSVSRSNSHPQCHKQRALSCQQQSSKPKDSNASSAYISGSSSDGSKVKSKVTWV